MSEELEDIWKKKENQGTNSVAAGPEVWLHESRLRHSGTVASTKPTSWTGH